LLFIDRINNESNSDYYNEGRIYCPNPCAEQPLPGWGVCNLGSLNLANFHNEGNGLDTKRLVQTTKAAVRFLDNVIDATSYITPEMEKQQKMERRVGLGTMGLGELLILKGMRYGSEESIEFIDELYELIAKSAYEASIELAEEKGKFARHDARFNVRPFVQKVCGEGKLNGMLDQHGIRNVTLLTQAPTGTIGTMVGTSTGIEPYPCFVWEYKSEMGLLKEAARPLKQWLVDNNHCTEDTLTDFIKRGGLDKLKEDGELPEYFVTAHDLEPEDHARVQAAIQKWTDASISKTSNLPEHYTVEQVGKFYQLLYDLGCKGGTVYREGSREAVIQRVTKEEKAKSESEEPTWDLKPLPGDGEVIPELRVGTQTPFGRVTTKLSMVDGVPFDLYQTIGHTGTDIMADQEAIGRLMSLVLRINSPVPPERRLEMIIDQLANIGGRAQIGFGKKSFSSIPDVIASNVDELRKSFLRRAHEDGGECGCGIGKAQQEQKNHLDICPECGNASLSGKKCVKCMNCGYESC
jgi:ribonucleoside-diphosphate reductase alpha chain